MRLVWILACVASCVALASGCISQRAVLPAAQPVVSRVEHATPVPRAATAAPLTAASIDETFNVSRDDWPDDSNGVGWFAASAYWLRTREAGQFVALNIPHAGVLNDGALTARVRKAGGPSGGGFGLVVADQGPEPLDGAFQGGRFIVAEAGDDGRFGVWQRDGDRWIDLVPWTENAAVHAGTVRNELRVDVHGRNVAFSINGVQLARFDTDLPAGRVGLFVGGDGNRVLLERLTIERSASPALGAPLPEKTPAPAPAATAVPTPSVRDALTAALDLAWQEERWPDVLRLLDQLERIAPGALDFREKRYAAHMSAGEAQLESGKRQAAADEFKQADTVDPKRGEAKAALVALTPVPTPTPMPRLPGADLPLTPFVDSVLGEIDRFWADYFRSRGMQYQPAARRLYSQTILSGCGRAVPGVLRGPFYCVRDSGLYLDAVFIDHTRRTDGDFPVGYVIAHEVGHHVQHLLGITKVAALIAFGDTFSREIELQADCLAGVWGKAAWARGQASPEDVGQALEVAWSLGDPAWASQRDVDAHGTPKDRTDFFLKGYNGSVPSACGLR